MLSVRSVFFVEAYCVARLKLFIVFVFVVLDCRIEFVLNDIIILLLSF